jgi:hypothetical protein
MPVPGAKTTSTAPETAASCPITRVDLGPFDYFFALSRPAKAHLQPLHTTGGWSHFGDPRQAVDTDGRESQAEGAQAQPTLKKRSFRLDTAAIHDVTGP